MKVASIFCSPLSSKFVIWEEFANLLTSIGLGYYERLVICREFNLPVIIESSIDSPLSSLLDVHGYHQHVPGSTWHDQSRSTASLLDLVITAAPMTSPPASDVQICSSHGLSDHAVCVVGVKVTRLRVRRY